MLQNILYLFKLIICVIVFINPSYSETTSKAAPPQNSTDKIQQFMEKQSKVLSTDFPYRLNLFTDGQIDKNKAGIRIAETASQFTSDNFGQLFFYQLYDHSMRVHTGMLMLWKLVLFLVEKCE